MESSFSWRLPFILLAAYSFVFSAVTLFYLPPSPRWLTVNGKAEEAVVAWEKLGVPAVDQEKILEQLDDSAALVEPGSVGVAMENLHRNTTNVSRRSQRKAQIMDVFSSQSRPRLFLAMFLMGMQQLSGIDGVLYVRLLCHHAVTHKLTLFSVRSDSLPASRSRLQRSEIPRFRRLSTRHFRRDYTSNHVGR